jgi:hypothetical protein
MAFRTREIGIGEGTVNGIPASESVQLLSTDNSILIASNPITKEIDFKAVNISTEAMSLIAPSSGIAAYSLVALAEGEQMRVADQSDSARMPVLGMVCEEILPNTRGRVVTSGVVENLQWNLLPKRTIFAGANGEITTTVFSSGYVQKIGVALTATKILLQIDEVYIRRS